MSTPDFTTTWSDGENPSSAKDNVAFRKNETWIKGAPPDYTASTISAAAADNSFNDSASGFPDWALNAGDELTSSGFTDPDNNERVTIVSATASKIVVSGAVLVDEAAGASISLVFHQAFTSRGVETRSPEWQHDTSDEVAPEPQFRHTYTGVGGGSEYRFLRNVLAEAFSTQGGKLQGSVSDTDDEVYELLASIDWARTGADTGTLAFNPYYLDTTTGAQLQSATPPLEVDDANHVIVNGGTGNGHEVEVDGDVRAAEFRQAGSPIGAWTLDTTGDQPTMTFTGNASATKWTARHIEVTSETECAINVPKLRGVGWQDQNVVAATASGVNCPARYGLPTYSSTLTGLTTVSVAASDNSFNDSLGLFPEGSFIEGDSVTFSGFAAEQNNRTFEIVSLTTTKVEVAGSLVVEESAGASITATFTAGYTNVCQTPALTRDGYYRIDALINVPFSSPGNLNGALMVGKIPGAPLSEIFGDGCTKFYCTGKALGETEQIHMTSKWNARAGDVLRCQLANTSEAAVTVQGSIKARWLSTGEDISPPFFEMVFGLGTLTVT